ncbi:SRPBCC family protein [Pseudonocardia spinosispora]|uniref:SRPBCC family protein n=1 Tax=Pseudonocardia spinosispora TaxID=103441 RepID=UPI0004229E02|nr:SRPBCC family protein [Pseudonocardia spinosispora]
MPTATLTATARETVRCTPDAMLEFVMDIERYQEIDDKIRPVLWARREGDRVEFACRPKLGGIRIPGAAVVQWIELTPGRRIDIGLVPSAWTRLASFHATFEVTEVAGGTRVDRQLRFTFSPVLRWLLQPVLAKRLPAEVRAELRRAKDYLESRGA